MNIKQIKADWNAGMTHGEIKRRHGLTDEQEYAIAVARAVYPSRRLKRGCRNCNRQ